MTRSQLVTNTRIAQAETTDVAVLLLLPRRPCKVSRARCVSPDRLPSVDRETGMSKLLRTAFALCSLFALSVMPASAGTIDFGTVAVEDKLIGGFNVGSSTAAEGDFLIDYLVNNEGYDESTLTYQKIDIAGLTSFVEVAGDPAGTNLWAINFAAFGVINPLMFMVKVGNAVYDHYLYDNLESLQYGVIDLNKIAAANGKVTITSISHTGVVTPEPASGLLVLLAAGGLAAARRRFGVSINN